jgi:hypothetical protein
MLLKEANYVHVKISNYISFCYTNSYFSLICCFVETMHWKEIMLTHPWRTMYMCFYITQHNKGQVLGRILSVHEKCYF